MDKKEKIKRGLPRREEWLTYQRLLAYMRPYSGRLALGILFGLVYAGANAGFLWAIKKGLAKVYDPTAPMPLVILFAAAIPLAGLIRGVGDYLSRYLIRWVGARVVADLRLTVFRRLTELPLGYFSRNRTGELISRTTNDTTMADHAVSGVVEDLAKEPLTLIFMIGWLFWIDPILAVASIVLFPVCIVPVALFGRRVRRFTREAQQRIADVVSILQETLVGIRVVKAFGMEDHEIERFGKQNNAFFKRIMRVAASNAAVDPLIIFISTLGVSLVLIYIRHRGMPFEQFVVYAGALLMMYTPVKKLSRIHLLIQQASAAADRIFEVIDTPTDVVDRPGAANLQGPVNRIEFRNVSFSYGDKAILKNIDLQVEAGQRIALVGSSGAGKTTLVNLLPRFYDVTGGAILINGTDIRDFSLKSLRQAMSIVTQETVLFNETVANNIGYGTVGASREAIEAAARKANADEFIRDLEGGYDHVIGEQGQRLSGGQRQRLAIARAILRNPPIMILDEATSALDTESERQVQAAMQNLMTGRTVFAIAHRLSTIANCDRIIVLDQGGIVESGTHEELMRQNGQYRYLYDLQFKDPTAVEE
jgi:subfamily B ATP-binding cassette protein MsbA